MDTCTNIIQCVQKFGHCKGVRLGEATASAMIVQPLNIQIVERDGREVSPDVKTTIVDLVSECGSIRQAAKMSNVNEATIRRWQAQDNDFRMALASALTGIKEIANDILLNIMKNPDSTNRDRIQATKVLAQINGHIVQRSEQVNVNIAGGMHELKEALEKRTRGTVLDG